MFSIHKDISSKITLYRWDTPTRGGGGVPATFSGTTKANNVRQFGDEAIRDTMRINDDGSLNIPNVNPRKHQGTWHCLDSQGNGATLDIKLQIAKSKKTSITRLDPVKIE